MNKKALIIGIDSTVGSALASHLSASGWLVYGTTRRRERVSKSVFYFDLAQQPTFHCPLPVEAVFLCAAVTKLADCRDDPAYSKRINHDALLQVAEYFLSRSTQLVFLSSSAVFNGEKPAYHLNEATCPRTPYGDQKALVEKKLQALSKDITIVRLTKILTPTYPLISHWITSLYRGERIEAFHDLRLCPVSIHTVTQVLLAAIEKKYAGIIHLSGEKDVSYQALAEFIAQAMQVSPQLINPLSARSVGIEKEEAPLYTSLDMSETKNNFAIADTSLAATMDNLYGDRFTAERQPLALPKNHARFEMLPGMVQKPR